jgi:hypothetical protein
MDIIPSCNIITPYMYGVVCRLEQVNWRYNKMISRSMGVVLCCIAAVWSLTGCSNDSTTGPDGGQTVISPDVFSVNSHPDMVLVGSEDSTYTFSYSGGPPEIAEGSIIVGLENGGYLRRVSSVSFRQDTLDIGTTWSSLTDAVISGSADTSFCLALDQLSFPDPGPIFTAPGVAISNRGLDLSGVTLFSGNTGNGDLSVVIKDGMIDFSPELTIGFEIRNREVEEFHKELYGDLDFELDVDLEASRALEVRHETLLASASTTAIQMIGDVPVVQVITVGIWGGFELRTLGEARWRIGTDADGSTGMGAIHQGGKWQQVWDNDIGYYGRSSEWNADCQIMTRVYVKPRIEVRFYGVACGITECEPYARFDGGTYPSPPGEWRLYAGIDGRLAFNLGILGANLSRFVASPGDPEIQVDSGTLTQWNLAYEEDFSTDPGWTTNRDSNYYWDPFNEVYYAEIWTADQDDPSDPETYSVVEVPYESGAWLRLEFDAQMIDSAWASGLNFGIYDEDLCFHGNANTINIEFTKPDEGAGFALFGHNCDYSNRANIDAAFVGWNLNEWYHVEILYEYGDIRAWVKNSSGTTVAVLNVKDFGEFCPGSSLYLGISRKCVRYFPKKAVAEIDNVRLYARSRD